MSCSSVAMSRGWDVEVFGWDEARRVFPGALRDGSRFVGFTVECSDCPPDLSFAAEIAASHPADGVDQSR